MSAATPAVVGLDLSITSTGIAYADGTTATIKPKPAKMRGGERLAFHRDALDDALCGAICGGERMGDGFGSVSLVVIEDYSPGSVGLSGKLTNAELRGVAALLAYDAGIPTVALIRPGTLKRWATGSGAADKDQMMAAARALGWTGTGDDEADAYLLRALGVQWLTGEGTPEQLAVCDEIAWPSRSTR